MPHSVPTLLAAALVLGSAPRAAVAARAVHAAPASATRAPLDPRADLKDAMRKLWEDHVTWTRLYIVSAVAGLPDADATAGRLLKNQVDIGNAIKPFYGEAAGDRLTALLRQHILTAADLIKAAKAGDQPAVQAASARWYANADEIADLLAGANPSNWPRDVMRSNMHHHLDLTLAEATARLKNDWAADVAAYDAIHEHILQLADVLSAGIVAQFPDKVR